MDTVGFFSWPTILVFVKIVYENCVYTLKKVLKTSTIFWSRSHKKNGTNTRFCNWKYMKQTKIHSKIIKNIILRLEISEKSINSKIFCLKFEEDRKNQNKNSVWRSKQRKTEKSKQKISMEVQTKSSKLYGQEIAQSTIFQFEILKILARKSENCC